MLPRMQLVMISHSDRPFQLIPECNGLLVFKPQPRRAISSREHSTLLLRNIRSSAAIQAPFYLFGYARQSSCANVQNSSSFLPLTMTDIRRCRTPRTPYQLCFTSWQAGNELRQHDREYHIYKKGTKKRPGSP